MFLPGPFQINNLANSISERRHEVNIFTGLLNYPSGKLFDSYLLLFWAQDLWPESILATGAVRSPLLLSQMSIMVSFIYKRCDRVLIQSQRFEGSAFKAGAEPSWIRYFLNWVEELHQSIQRDKLLRRQGIAVEFLHLVCRQSGRRMVT